jgi:hypothetical protein
MPGAGVVHLINNYASHLKRCMRCFNGVATK